MTERGATAVVSFFFGGMQDAELVKPSPRGDARIIEAGIGKDLHNAKPSQAI